MGELLHRSTARQADGGIQSGIIPLLSRTRRGQDLQQLWPQRRKPAQAVRDNQAIWQFCDRWDERNVRALRLQQPRSKGRRIHRWLRRRTTDTCTNMQFLHVFTRHTHPRPNRTWLRWWRNAQTPIASRQTNFAKVHRDREKRRSVEHTA